MILLESQSDRYYPIRAVELGGYPMLQIPVSGEVTTHQVGCFSVGLFISVLLVSNDPTTHSHLLTAVPKCNQLSRCIPQRLAGVRVVADLGLLAWLAGRGSNAARHSESGRAETCEMPCLLPPWDMCCESHGSSPDTTENRRVPRPPASYRRTASASSRNVYISPTNVVVVGGSDGGRVGGHIVLPLYTA